MTYRMIHIGLGGMGRHWCEVALPPNIADGLIEVVAAVDINPAALSVARNTLGLTPEQCYTDAGKAMAENEADFCTIVVPPARHEEVVDLALAHGLHILSEKPIADTLAASVRIADKVKRAGAKMGVTMSHRFDQDKTSFREELRSGRYGALDYLVCHLTCDLRQRGSWGDFRHEIPHPLMIEGAVHQLDMLADLAGAHCDTIYAQSWNPPWGEYAGDSQALVMMRFENGRRAFFEGACTNAVGLKYWEQETIRAECELGTLVLNARRLERFPYDPSRQRVTKLEGEGEPLPLLPGRKWKNSRLVEQFAQWLDGGETMETNIEDNLQSAALIFAVIESSRTGQPVKVQELLNQAREG
ncbi:MAG: Gfo/Idh/MocA family oxidoreductase [Chloroflexota bacterium]|nr:Gfo/Idh/MocA family oxidoreductase [Chloroflexota bacterium]MDE2908261.1 Gfo/Idh/MocA family oxidoreductase [Chloroflexota bacterium]